MSASTDHINRHEQRSFQHPAAATGPSDSSEALQDFSIKSPDLEHVLLAPYQIDPAELQSRPVSSAARMAGPGGRKKSG